MASWPASLRRRAVFVPQLSSPPHAVLTGSPVCQAGRSPGPLGAESVPGTPSNGPAASAWLEVGCWA